MRSPGNGQIYFLVRILSLLWTSISANETAEECMLLETEDSFERSTGGVNLWPNARVPYTIDQNYDEKGRQVFETAIAEYHSKTCVRFEPKSGGDVHHIHMRIVDLPYCGAAHLCLQGIGAQEIDISPNCVFLRTHIHELGHALCLLHEQVRFDRDKYLDFSECNDPSKIHPVSDKLPSRIQIYDYNSRMHYYCGECFGNPSRQTRRRCGSQVNPERLSVIDADRINEMYNCQGCFSHRWYRLDTMTPSEEATLVSFGIAERGGPAYLCRGFIEGEGHIYPGVYDPSEKACIVGAHFNVYTITDDIQLFGLPNGQASISNTTVGYSLLRPLRDDPQAYHVRAGRQDGNSEVVAAVKEIQQEDGTSIVLLGWTHAYPSAVAHFAYKNEQIFSNFYGKPDEEYPHFVLGCLD